MSRLMALVPRLTAPLIVRGDGLPPFGKTVQWPGRQNDRDGQDPHNEYPAEKTEPAQILYTTLATPQHNDDSKSTRGELQDEGKASEKRPTQSSLQQTCRRAADHRVVFFGEQHHQPKVLSAQLQVLYHVLQHAKDRGSKVHVVFEQWSLEDQPMLSSDRNVYDNKAPPSASETAEGEQSSPSKTSEGFNSDHYTMLVQLVREMHGSVWGGFPPREWARIVAKGAKVQTASSDADSESSALQKVQELDSERFDRTLAALGGDKNGIIPPLPIERQRFITNVGWGHRAYLKGMFRPDERPPVPDDVQHRALPPEERAGFLAAQALKDTYFAHTIATLLQRDPLCTVVAICGAGHCEWSFGAPERVREMLVGHDTGTAKSNGVQPYIFLSKPDDAGFWPEENMPRVFPPSIQYAVEQHQEEQWQRKQADSILLYEWVD